MENQMEAIQISEQRKYMIKSQAGNGNEIGYYTDDQTKRGLAEACGLVSMAFPKFTEGQIKILKDEWLDHGFTDKQAIDAVKHVIYTYEYAGTPPLALFLKFDKPSNIYTYQEVLKLVDGGMKPMKDYFEIYDKAKGLWKRK